MLFKQTIFLSQFFQLGLKIKGPSCYSPCLQINKQYLVESMLWNVHFYLSFSHLTSVDSKYKLKLISLDLKFENVPILNMLKNVINIPKVRVTIFVI
jgi:hypothetical protein